jgi:hypothetical protein
MKLLKSTCEKAWLFDCIIEDDCIKAGLACFVPLASSPVVFVNGEKHYSVSLPSKAVDQPGAIRIANARLPLLD